MTVADIRFAAIEGSVSAPAGFRAAGVACGIKKSNGLDLALIVSDRLASAAAVFTTNKAQAAPVLVSKACLQVSGGRARAIVINSGCANACTGPEGMQTAEVMADTAGRVAGAAASEALVASTGVIGVALDREAITRGIEAAFEELSSEGGPAAARAIMTTDPFPKEAAVEVTTPAGTFRVGGIAKGSGMIEPLMATMLGVVTTDAQVAPALLQRALGVATGNTAIEGDIAVGAGETEWRFTPRAAWSSRRYDLVILSILEDPMGNKVGRPFDVDSFTQIDKSPTPERMTLPFDVR